VDDRLASGRRCLLWGSAGHAKVLAAILSSRGDRLVALFDNNLTVTPAVLGVPLMGGLDEFLHWIGRQDLTSPLYGWVAVGGHRGRDRITLQLALLQAGIRMPPLIHPSAFVCPTASVGAGSQVLAQAVVAAEAQMGQACIINHRASVDHECVLGNGVHVAPGATLCGCVTVGHGAMIGAGAVILPRLKIGEDAIVGAGAVVTHNVPSGAVYIGNPARAITQQF
jgi:sugar O-acyltransferase (sialic acid O-acetyltransferase NeuD family)